MIFIKRYIMSLMNVILRFTTVLYLFGLILYLNADRNNTERTCIAFSPLFRSMIASVITCQCSYEILDLIHAGTSILSIICIPRTVPVHTGGITCMQIHHWFIKTDIISHHGSLNRCQISSIRHVVL